METENKEKEQQAMENKEQQARCICFDESEFFKKEISPKLEAIVALCHEKGIPILVHAIHKQTEDGCACANMSSVNNRNGQGVHDLVNCQKILCAKKNILLSFALNILAEKL